jgi:hypothetical protein
MAGHRCALVAVIDVWMALIAFRFTAQKHWSHHLVIAMFSLIIVYASILGALKPDSSRGHVACHH